MSFSIFLAGDSTVADYPETSAPQAGWGQTFPAFLDPSISVRNHAANGRSSKSFIDEGRLDAIRDEIAEGDYLFIQFGHNDSKQDERFTDPFTTYKEHLLRYIETAREKKAHPLLITPVARRKFGSDGTVLDTHGDYPEAMKELAREQSVPVIDLHKRSLKLLDTLGPIRSKALYMWIDPHPNFPDGAMDNTHFNEDGAHEIAAIVKKELEGVVPVLTPIMK
ncbi:rhamnogalacturonan acetylesterase [Rossellomorea marisflavi]|uniref:rhamnogalacturonan acetylesterase n=1 Tax=Rossellomorea marisflavi TaxID=189381 RepID=UPI003457867D